MSDPFFIDDDYTREETIPAVRSRHPALTIRYRPALLDQRFAWQRAIGKDDTAERMRMACQIIEKHVVEWNALNKGGEKAAIKADMLKRMPAPLFDKMLDIVLGYAGSEEEREDVGNSSAA